MTSPKFICRLFPYSDYNETYDEIGNFESTKGRQEDEVVVFTGMFGIEGYMIWFLHQDLQQYDFSTVGINLRLFLEGTTSMPYWSGRYRVIDVKYDTKVNKYVVFAIDEDSAKLKTKMVDYDISSLKWNEERTAEQVLKEVLEPTNIFKVHYSRHPQETELVNFRYRYFDINKEWSVLDFINYIADENEFEWAVRNGVLYIGKEIKAYRKRRSGRKVNLEKDRVASSGWFYKISGETRPMDILSHLEGQWKCVWAKHWVGQSGGTSRGCFTEIGKGTVDRKMYFDTLEGKHEKANASILLSHNSPSHYVTLGNIIEDVGELKYIDKISTQVPLDFEKVTDPTQVRFEDGTDQDLLLMKEKVARTSSYIDNEAGLQFPSPELEDDEGNKKKAPNSLIFNIQGKEHMSAVGPYVYGTENTEFKIPFKEKEDFRLRFPDGAELFYDASKQTWFLQSGKGWVYKQAVTDYDKEPQKSRLADEENMFQIYDGNVLWDTVTSHMHILDGGCFQVVPKTGPQPDDPYRRYALVCDNEYGTFTIEAKDEIEIKIYYQGALASGTITIDTQGGTIKIGENASSVKLAGGGKKVAHANHDHQLSSGLDGLFSLPLKLKTMPCTDNSSKTEVD